MLSRTALAVERRTLAEKITSNDLDALYRDDKPLSLETVGLIKKSIEILNAGLENSDTHVPKFNKATLFSWLIFLVRGLLAGNTSAFGSNLSKFLSFFELTRSVATLDPESSKRLIAEIAPANRLFSTYEIRSSARVADVSSVILRDAVIWLAFEDFWFSSVLRKDPLLKGLDRLHSAFSRSQGGFEDDVLARKLIERGWGNLP